MRVDFGARGSDGNQNENPTDCILKASTRVCRSNMLFSYETLHPSGKKPCSGFHSEQTHFVYSSSVTLKGVPCSPEMGIVGTSLRLQKLSRRKTLALPDPTARVFKTNIYPSVHQHQSHLTYNGPNSHGESFCVGISPGLRGHRQSHLPTANLRAT